MQKRRCDARTSRFKALHGSARYFQRKLQAIRNLARRGDSLQHLEAVDAANWRGKLSFTSFFKQAGWLRGSQVHYDDGRSWQKLARRNDALSRIPRWIDWVLKEMKNSLFLSHFLVPQRFRGTFSSFNKRVSATFYDAFFRKLRVWESKKFCPSLTT